MVPISRKTSSGTRPATWDFEDTGASRIQCLFQQTARLRVMGLQVIVSRTEIQRKRIPEELLISMGGQRIDRRKCIRPSPRFL